MAPVCLENFDMPFVEPVTVDGDSAVQLLAKIEANNPSKSIICVIWDNAAYHRCAAVKMALTSEMPYPSDPVTRILPAPEPD
jgi:hypothetical protein